MLSEGRLISLLVETIRKAAVSLPPDVEQRIREAYVNEESGRAREMLRAILDNIKLAREKGLPLCQDTGLISFYVRAGTESPFIKPLCRILRRAVTIATKEIPLRPNAVDILTGVNSGDNTGSFIPWVSWELIPDEDLLEVTVFLKGGGSEAPCFSEVLSPAKGLRGAMKLVVNTIARHGPNPCPPLIIGIGLGGTFDIACNLAKKALLRSIGSLNPRSPLAKLEEAMLELINELGIGPYGVGGRTTALAVHVEAAHRHPATFSVAMCVNCWALRRATLSIGPDGHWAIRQ